MKYIYTFLAISFITFNIAAQRYTRPSEWTKYRKEIFISSGTSEFLGDLGGGAGIGRQYSPADINFSQTRTAFGLGARYKVRRWMNTTVKFNYLQVKGDDASSKNQVRNNRNLNFKSNIFELSGRLELGYQTSRTSGNRYGIRRNYSASSKIFTHNFFGFIGLGIFYYNPKGKDAKGDYVNLRPLHTEGQGLPGGPKQYGPVSIAIPIGIFYKVNINKIWSLGIEMAWRKTFTDYIDDVGSKYYDSKALSAAYGPLSAQMSDPSLGKIDGATKPSANGTPAKKGGNQKDSYMTFEITAGYIIKQKRKSARLRSKF